MKLIIAGSRHMAPTLDEMDYIVYSLPEVNKITEIVSGGCRGVDAAGERWARENDVPVKLFNPDWLQYGKSAGPSRNHQMAQYADALLLIWDGNSRGSASMKREMEKLGKPVYEVQVYFHRSWIEGKEGRTHA